MLYIRLNLLDQVNCTFTLKPPDMGGKVSNFGSGPKSSATHSSAPPECQHAPCSRSWGRAIRPGPSPSGTRCSGGRGQAAGLALAKEHVQSAGVPVGSDRLAHLEHVRQVQLEGLVGDVPAGRAELDPGDVLQVAAGANNCGREEPRSKHLAHIKPVRYQ